jgi:hypothetical protein
MQAREAGMARQANRTQASNQMRQARASGNRLSGGPSRNPSGVRNKIPKYPAAPAAPGVANGAPGNQSAPFLDSTYFANTAQNQFSAQNQLSDISQQDSYNQTDAFTAKARLDQQEPFAEQGLKENAARQGLIGSTRTNTQVGLQQRDYLQQRGDIDLKAARTHASNQAAMQAIQAGLPIQQAAELAAAADRQTVRDQAAADAGALTQNPAPAAKPQPAKTKPAKPKRGRQHARSNTNGPHRPRHRRSR